MDSISLVQVPKELMADAVANLNNPLQFSPPVSMLGDDYPEAVVESVVCSVAAYLADEEVQAEIGQRLAMAYVTNWLPDDPYERREFLACIAAEVCHAIGER